MNGLKSSPWRVAVGDEETSAVWDSAGASPGRVVFVCAHGAGGHMADRSLLGLTEVLGQHGLNVVRFNFLYREQRSARPDPMPRLVRCFSAVLARVHAELDPGILIIGGRSMGGRAASVLAADHVGCDGLLLLAYPLHPPGQPEKLRSAHLPAIAVPVLCCNGTRDPFCRRELMEEVLRNVGPRWTMRWLEGADHSFHVLKRSGTTDAAVLAEVASATQAWVEGLDPSSTHGNTGATRGR